MYKYSEYMIEFLILLFCIYNILINNNRKIIVNYKHVQKNNTTKSTSSSEYESYEKVYKPNENCFPSYTPSVTRDFFGPFFQNEN